jgi:predicted esterase
MTKEIRNKDTTRIRHLLLLFVWGIILGSVLFLYSESILRGGQQLNLNVPPETPPVLEPEVAFLPAAPRIDGVLDLNLSMLPVRKFNYSYRLNAKNPDVPVQYRLAYGADFFYVYIEVETDQIIYRDRGYQNGDGFGLVLAIPQPENKPTDEFYVLGFSATNSPSMQWAKKIVWYFNVDLSFLRLSNDTLFEIKQMDRKVGFELLLPWKEVYPYHPWLSEAIGFNLWFVKAIGETQQNYYIVVNDMNVGSEQKKRLYTKLKFQKPTIEHGTRYYMTLDRNHSSEGDTARARIACLSAASGKEQFVVSIHSGEGERVNSETFDSSCSQELRIEEQALKTAELVAGGYRIKWSSVTHDFKGETGLTVLPRFDFTSMEEHLERIKSKISEGSLMTLQFKLEELRKLKSRLKPYQTCAGLRTGIYEFLELEEKAAAGEDVLAKKTGILRRAFRSHLDNTLQPYSVKIPENFDPTEKYPLLVFLHGSARDDRDIQTHDYVAAENTIVLAPCARGTSNCYSADNAQEDIQEAIQDVLRNYPVDTRKIILCGFSMGGYGVYRTFYENPKMFKALAVFSGDPNMANRWGISGGPHPNFIEDKYLKAFKDIPIFVFHGKKDRNCPFELAAQVVEKLKAVGARVEFYTEEETGHSRPGSETIKLYHEWLKKIIDTAGGF